jgi:hypothetical protein
LKVQFDSTALRQTRWHGHVVRFALGGLVTVATGLVAKWRGPVVGGLFLSFPAIFPIGLAMIEKLQNQQVGPSAKGDRARRAGVAEAVGAGAGSIGLIGFALAAWIGARTGSALLALGPAMVIWLALALGSWAIRRVLIARLR